MRYYSNSLEHHGILKQKWGHRNGPPYPLGSGDHSSAEKQAASDAGIKVGKSSGKGSIEKVKKAKKKKPLTEEEKRLKAEEAQTRAQIRKNLEGSQEKKMTKSEKEIDEAIKSGDKEKIKAQADKMTTNQLRDAMDKVDLMQKLNYQPPAPTTMDKIDSAMKKVDKARDWMEKGLKAYDALAAINNTFNKENQWPRPNDKKNENKFENVAKKVAADVQNNHQENVKREADKQEKKEQKQIEKQERKAEKSTEKQEKKEQKKAEVDKNISKSVDNKLTANEDAMFRAISNPNAFDSNGNFNWDYYDKERK